MSEREMLEYAAKACGLKGFIHEWINGPEWVIPGENPKTFNPLKDDGDCARMEARLGISVDWAALNVMCGFWDGADSESATERYSDHNGDKQAARRLASLRVAAEIGRAM